MKKELVKIKHTLSMNDRIQMPQELADGYFTTDSKGNTLYTPYYADIALIQVFFLHCIEGLTFEIAETEDGTDEITENIYESVINDNELMELYDSFFEIDKNTIHDCPYKETVLQMYGIISDVEKMVEYRKQELLFQKEDHLTTLLQALTEKLRQLDVEKLNLNDVLKYSIKNPLSGNEEQNI